MKLDDAYYAEHPEESLFKPLDPLTRIIERTSAADMLLFLIALQRKENQTEKP